MADRDFKQEFELILKQDVQDAVAKTRLLAAEIRAAMSDIRADLARANEGYRSLQAGALQSSTALKAEMQQVGQYIRTTAAELKASQQATQAAEAALSKALEASSASLKTSLKSLASDLEKTQTAVDKLARTFEEKLSRALKEEMTATAAYSAATRQLNAAKDAQEAALKKVATAQSTVNKLAAEGAQNSASYANAEKKLADAQTAKAAADARVAEQTVRRTVAENDFYKALQKQEQLQRTMSALEDDLAQKQVAHATAKAAAEKAAAAEEKEIRDKFATAAEERQAKTRAIMDQLKELAARYRTLSVAEQQAAQQGQQHAAAGVRQTREQHERLRQLEATLQQVYTAQNRLALGIQQGSASGVRAAQTLLGPLGAILNPIVAATTASSRLGAAFKVLPPTIAAPLAAIGVLGGAISGLVGLGINLFRSLTQTVMSFGQTVLAAGRTLQQWAQETGTAAVELRTLQQITGATAKEAGGLAVAFQALGQPAFIVNAAMGTLTTAMAKNDETFKRMGVSIRNEADQSLRPAISVLLDMAEKYEQAANKTDAVANASLIFSGWMSGTMIPLLSMGKVGLQDFITYLDKMGLTFDELTRDKLIAARGGFNLFGLELQRLKAQVVADLAPSIVMALTAIVQVLPSLLAGVDRVMNGVNAFATGVLSGFGVKITNESRKAVAAMVEMSTAGTGLQETVGQENAAIERNRNKLKDMAQAHESTKDTLNATKQALERTRDGMKEVDAASNRLAEGGIAKLEAELRGLKKSGETALAPFLATVKTLKSELEGLKDDARAALTPLKDAVEGVEARLLRVQRTRQQVEAGYDAERKPVLEQQRELEADSLRNAAQRARIQREEATATAGVKKELEGLNEQLQLNQLELGQIERAAAAAYKPLQADLKAAQRASTELSNSLRLMQTVIEAQKAPHENLIKQYRSDMEDVRHQLAQDTRAPKLMLESMQDFIKQLKEDETEALRPIERMVDAIRQKIEQLKEAEQAALQPLNDQIEAINDQIDELQSQADAEDAANAARIEQLRIAKRESAQAVSTAPGISSQIDQDALDRAQRMAELTAELAEARRHLSAASQALTRDFAGELAIIERQLTVDQEALNLLEEKNQAEQDARREKQLQLQLEDLLGISELGRLRAAREALTEEDTLHRRRGESRSAFRKRQQLAEIDDKIQDIEKQRQVEAAKQAIADNTAQKQYDKLRKDLQERIKQEEIAADAVRDAWKAAQDAQVDAQKEVDRLLKEQEQLTKEIQRAQAEAARAGREAALQARDAYESATDAARQSDSATKIRINQLRAQAKVIQRQARAIQKSYERQEQAAEKDLKAQERLAEATKKTYAGWVDRVEGQARLLDKSINQTEAQANGKLLTLQAQVDSEERTIQNIEKTWKPAVDRLKADALVAESRVAMAEQRLQTVQDYWEPRIEKLREDAAGLQGEIAWLSFLQSYITKGFAADIQKLDEDDLRIREGLANAALRLQEIEEAWRGWRETQEQAEENARRAVEDARAAYNTEKADFDKKIEAAQQRLDDAQQVYDEKRDALEAVLKGKQEQIAEARADLEEIRRRQAEDLVPLEAQIDSINSQLNDVEQRYHRDRQAIEDELQRQTQQYSNFVSELQKLPSTIQDISQRLGTSLFDRIMGKPDTSQIAQQDAVNWDPEKQTDLLANENKWKQVGRHIGERLAEGLDQKEVKDKFKQFAKNIGELIGEGIITAVGEVFQTASERLLRGGPAHTWVSPAKDTPPDVIRVKPGEDLPDRDKVYREGVEALGKGLARKVGEVFRKFFPEDPKDQADDYKQAADSWAAAVGGFTDRAIRGNLLDPVKTATSTTFQGGLSAGVGAVAPPVDPLNRVFGDVSAEAKKAWDLQQPTLAEDIKATFASSIAGGAAGAASQMGQGDSAVAIGGLSSALRDAWIGQLSLTADSQDATTGIRGGVTGSLIGAILAAAADAKEKLASLPELVDADHLGGFATAYAKKMSEALSRVVSGVSPGVPQMPEQPNHITGSFTVESDQENPTLVESVRKMLLDGMQSAIRKATVDVPQKLAEDVQAFAAAAAGQIQTKFSDTITPVLGQFETDLNAWWNGGVVAFLEKATPWNDAVDANWSAGFTGKIKAYLESLIKLSKDESSGAIPLWNKALLDYLGESFQPLTPQVEANWKAFRDFIVGVQGKSILDVLTAAVTTWIGASGQGGLLGLLSGFKPWDALDGNLTAFRDNVNNLFENLKPWDKASPNFTLFETNARAVMQRLEGTAAGSFGSSLVGLAQAAVTGVGQAFGGLWSASRQGFDDFGQNVHASLVAIAGTVNVLGRQLLGVDDIINVKGMIKPSIPPATGSASRTSSGGGGGGSVSQVSGSSAVGGATDSQAMESVGIRPTLQQQPVGHTNTLPKTDADIRRLIDANYIWLSDNDGWFRDALDDPTAGASALWAKAFAASKYSGGFDAPGGVLGQVAGALPYPLSAAGQTQAGRWLKILAEVMGGQPWTYPVSGPIRQMFGFTDESDELYGKGNPHTGVDFAVNTGTEIKAPAPGKIVQVLDQGASNYGYHVVLQHEPNLLSIFGHMLPGTAKPVGTVLKQGEVLGKSDNTGYSKGPHLHWELRQNGQAIDPIGFTARSGVGTGTKGPVPSAIGTLPAGSYKHLSLPGGDPNPWILNQYAKGALTVDDLVGTVLASYPPPSWFASTLLKINEKYRLNQSQLQAATALSWVESRYQLGVDNTRGSGAKGLFQLMPFNRRDYGVKDFDAASEIEGGIRYILGRAYQQGGTPRGSLQFWLNHGWYRNGGLAGLYGPEVAMVGHGPEFVINTEATQALARQGVVSMSAGAARVSAPDFMAAIHDGTVARAVRGRSDGSGQGPTVNNHMTVHAVVQAHQRTPQQEYHEQERITKNVLQRLAVGG